MVEGTQTILTDEYAGSGSPDMSIYLTDGMAAFWHSVHNMDEGYIPVDLLDGVEPTHVADIIKSVAQQSKEGAIDSFWPDMAAEVVRNAAVAARAFDATPAGVDWRKEHNERPYSLSFIYQLAMDSGSLTRHVVETISGTIEPGGNSDLTDAIDFLNRVWLLMVPPTRDGIKEAISYAMGNSVPVAVC